MEYKSTFEDFVRQHVGLPPAGYYKNKKRESMKKEFIVKRWIGCENDPDTHLLWYIGKNGSVTRSVKLAERFEDKKLAIKEINKYYKPQDYYEITPIYSK